MAKKAKKAKKAKAKKAKKSKKMNFGPGGALSSARAPNPVRFGEWRALGPPFDFRDTQM